MRVTTQDRFEQIGRGPHYDSLEEADAVIKLALAAGIAEAVVYDRVKAKAGIWGLSPTQTARRLLLAEEARLAPDW